MVASGLIAIPSRFGPKETMERLVSEIGNDPAWIAERHAVSPETVPAVNAMAHMLAGLSQQVTESGSGNS